LWKLFRRRGVRSPSPPERVELRFSEPVDAEFDPVVVRNGGGVRVDKGEASVDPEDARVVLAGLEKLPEGSYTVKWRVTSIDGHVVEGRYDFAVAVVGEDQSSGDAEKNGEKLPKPQGRTADTMSGTTEEVPRE
jgi:CopC domain-containing protein